MSDIVERLGRVDGLDDETLETATNAAAEIERLRARVAELEADNADFKKLIADELAETFRLFGAVGLNEADDFGTKTAIEAVRERIESIKADRDHWKAEALAWRAGTYTIHGDIQVDYHYFGSMLNNLHAARAANGGAA